MPIQNVIADQSSITVLGDQGEFYYISSQDVVYREVRDYLIDQRGTDLDHVADLITGTREAVETLTAAAQNAVDGDGDGAYRLKHGDPVDAVVFDTAVKLNLNGEDPAAVVKFLQRLERNPSEASRSQLFAWLQAGGFSITSDGLVIGYKAVTAEGKSYHGGVEPCTLTYADGTSEVITGTIPYPIGATAEMPRELVDDNRDAACSVGFHVGTFAFAVEFGNEDGSILVILFDPAHVVSVPRHAADQKVRVHKLFVAAEYDGEKIPDTIVTAFDADAAKVYGERPENTRPVAEYADDSVDWENEWDDSEDWDDEYDDEDDSDDEDEDDDSDPDESEDVTVAADPILSEVRVRVTEIVSDTPMMKGVLDKRFSKKRRALLGDALDALVKDGTLTRDENGVYRA